jgi:hypothetical protein
MDASARDERSLPDEALNIVARGFGREFDEPIALPNGRYAHDLGRAPMRF